MLSEQRKIEILYRLLDWLCNLSPETCISVLQNAGVTRSEAE